VSNSSGPEEPILEVDVIIVELVDIEEYAKRGEKPPRAHHYRFRVDDHYYTTHKAELTGKEILEFAGKTPEGYHLRQRLRGGQVRAIAPKQVVDLREHHLERFMTIPCENQDGETHHDR
jgi:hypothetical protein